VKRRRPHPRERPAAAPAADRRAAAARPLIGVTTSEVRRSETVRQTPQGEPPQVEMALGLKYLRAIEAAGGLPVVLPPLAGAAIEPLIEHLAGICLSGGPDLGPETYGEEERHPELGPTEDDVDRFELALARIAWERDLPLLAICRGAQALNVARGGTLVQHLPDLGEVGLAHRQESSGDETTHEVEIEPESLLARVMGTTSASVNSFHHQAVRRLGSGLRIVARSPDGVAEAIEAPGAGYVLGVQWHAECLVDRPEQAALFESLVDAAREGLQSTHAAA
jgi:putative glutamine amidotransferase